MNVVNKRIDEITPYENNPRHNDQAVEYVANSIKQFGWKVPIVIDADGVIVAGHTRWKAAKSLGIKEVPCVVADDLTEEQVKAYRLADNKVAEISSWDYGMLEEELQAIEDIAMEDFGFDDLDNDIINGLVEEEFTSVGKELDSFAMTFVFPMYCKDTVDAFVKKNGKDTIVDRIIRQAQEDV